MKRSDNVVGFSDTHLFEIDQNVPEIQLQQLPAHTTAQFTPFLDQGILKFESYLVDSEIQNTNHFSNEDEITSEIELTKNISRKRIDDTQTQLALIKDSFAQKQGSKEERNDTAIRKNLSAYSKRVNFELNQIPPEPKGSSVRSYPFDLDEANQNFYWCT